jgi:hypothetical protein
MYYHKPCYICSLNVVGVAVVGIKQPGVTVLDKNANIIVGPEFDCVIERFKEELP